MRLIRLILSRQIRVPFWKATPTNAASPAVGITSRYRAAEKCPIDGITNAGSSPKKIWQTKVAVTDAISTWARKPRLFRSLAYWLARYLLLLAVATARKVRNYPQSR